ncbi:MAG TPA: hypothetical protein VNS58_01240 [Puia sp.]|nr:hypothetical protein [Puia sp.]
MALLATGGSYFAESEYRGMGSKVQQVIAQIEAIEPIVQQPAAQIQASNNEHFRVSQDLITENLFLETIIAKISWAHHMILMDKVVTPAERFWYMVNTLEHGVRIFISICYFTIIPIYKLRL